MLLGDIQKPGAMYLDDKKKLKPLFDGSDVYLVHFNNGKDPVKNGLFNKNIETYELTL